MPSARKERSPAHTPAALLDEIRDKLRAYCETQHDFRFDPEHPVVRLHEPTFSADEISVALDVLLSTRVTMGPKVKAFEREFADSFGFAHGVSNNSGSSANLLAISALSNQMAVDGFKEGDEVIVPALSWSTTVWPLIQNGLVPVVVDIDPRTLNIDVAQIEQAISPKARGIMPVHVYGNPCDMNAITEIAHRHGLVIVEDCCEALGARYDNRSVGKYGRVATFSFYFSHHITTLEGGICVTDDFETAELMRILRAHGWIREVEDRDRWIKRYPDMDPKFLFVNLGYNLRCTELQGAMGSVQLPKLSGFVERRRENTHGWQQELSCWSEFMEFQQETPKAYSSCFGFPIILTERAPFTVADITRFLNAAHIETRPIICGNIARQPGMQLYKHRTVGDLAWSTRVMNRGFSFGNHQFIDHAAREYVSGKIREFMRDLGIS
ncbi:MAG: DegT/DnrJ/EryC1/StrS family aminotransferase [Acidiferrobacteraceae bacterium]